jgi:DNA-binding transcriptional ArsR family regulator
MAGFKALAESFAEKQTQSGVKLRVGEVAGWIHAVEGWLKAGRRIEWKCADILNYLMTCSVAFDCSEACRFGLSAAPTTEISAKQAETIFPPEVQAAAIMILRDNPIEYVVKAGGMLHKGDEILLEVDWLSMLTMQIGQQLHLMPVGATGKGKSHHGKVSLEFSPPEYVIFVNEPSPKSFFYAQRAGIRFDKAVVFIDDARGDHIPVLKSLSSPNRLKPRAWSVEDQEFIDLQIEGNLTVWTSSVSPLRDEGGQLTRRFVVVNPTEDTWLDEAVARHIIDSRRRGITKVDLPKEFEIVKCMTKILKEKKCRVTTPFDFEIPSDPQRTLPAMFITLLEASAVANQFRRITVEKGQERLILAEPEDFEEARKCWQYLALYQMKVDAIGLRVLDALADDEPTGAIDEKGREVRPEPGEKAPTVTWLAKKLKESPATIQKKLNNLYEAGLVDRKWWGAWNTAHYYWRTNLSWQPGKASRSEVNHLRRTSSGSSCLPLTA